MIVPRRTVAGTAVFLAMIALWIMADSLRVAAAPPFQTGDDPIVVSNKWCEFDLDYDDDGESNGSFDPDDGSYLPQETPILGKCNFTFTAAIKSTILFDSELDDWRADVTLTEEPSGAVRETGTVHPGNRQIEGATGGMVATVDLKGRTPRGELPRDLPQGYQHQVQIPERFRLLEITIITSADDRERVASHEVSAASNAYIEARQEIAGIRGASETAPPAEVMDLADQLLAEGYPGIAERVAALQLQPAPPPVVEDTGGSNIWMVIAIVAIVIIVIGLVVIGIMVTRSDKGTDPLPRPQPRP